VEIRTRTPYLGEHNETVLARYLGYSTEKVAELTRAGVLIAQAMPK
jgi:crotonobetainyl-CoA:carnitine CoA-transferase CaiB-like acyl-CoA transferase